MFSYENATHTCSGRGMELPLTPHTLNETQRNFLSNKNGTWVRIKKQTRATWYTETEEEGNISDCCIFNQI